MGNHRKPPNSKAAVLVKRFARRAQTYRCACIISSFDRFEHAACRHSHLLSSICWISLNIVEYCWISLNIVEFRWISLNGVLNVFSDVQCDCHFSSYFSRKIQSTTEIHRVPRVLPVEVALLCDSSAGCPHIYTEIYAWPIAALAAPVQHLFSPCLASIAWCKPVSNSRMLWDDTKIQGICGRDTPLAAPQNQPSSISLAHFWRWILDSKHRHYPKGKPALVACWP